MIKVCSTCGSENISEDGFCFECVADLLEKMGRKEMKDKFDPVDKPVHYGQGSIECIDYIEDFLTREEYIGYLRGNIAKYMHRWRYKNKDEDLKKARWYLDRLIEFQREA